MPADWAMPSRLLIPRRVTSKPAQSTGAAGGWLHSAGGPRKQKPRQGAGLSWSRLSDGAGRRSRGQKRQRQARPTNAEPHRWLHSTQGGDARTKKPRRSGAKFLARVCPSRVKANPPTPYHSRLHSVRPQKKPRRSGAKSAMWAAEKGGRNASPHRDTTTETVAQHTGNSHSGKQTVTQPGCKLPRARFSVRPSARKSQPKRG